MKARVKKRSASRSVKCRMKAKDQLVKTAVTTPARRVQFTQFQVIHGGAADHIYGLGVDGLIYIFDVSNEIWLQCPLGYKTDHELSEAIKAEEVGVR